MFCRSVCRFVPDADAWRETWDGARLSTDAALEVFGADEALPLSQVSLVLGRQACNDHTCVVWCILSACESRAGLLRATQFLTWAYYK